MPHSPPIADSPHDTTHLTGNLELHWLSEDIEQTRGDLIRICIVSTPNESSCISSQVQQRRDWNLFNRWLTICLGHRLPGQTAPPDLDTIKKVCIRSIRDTALKLITINAYEVEDSPTQDRSRTDWLDQVDDDLILPSPNLVQSEWTNHEEFHRNMLAKRHYCVGMLSNGSLVTKLHGDEEVVSNGPHDSADFCIWCLDETESASEAEDADLGA